MDSEAMKPRLTLKEISIIGLLSEGKSYKQIACQMAISPRTVEWHVSNMFKKTQCRNKIEIIRFAREMGLLKDGKTKGHTTAYKKISIPLIIMFCINGLCLAILLKILALFQHR